TRRHPLPRDPSGRFRARRERSGGSGPVAPEMTTVGPGGRRDSPVHSCRRTTTPTAAVVRAGIVEPCIEAGGAAHSGCSRRIPWHAPPSPAPVAEAPATPSHGDAPPTPAPYNHPHARLRHHRPRQGTARAH